MKMSDGMFSKQSKILFSSFFFLLFSFSFSFSLCSSPPHPHILLPHRTFYISLMMSILMIMGVIVLIMIVVEGDDTQAHTSLTHIYHTNQQPSMSSPEFKSLQTPHSPFPNNTLNLPLSLSQNNHFSCQSSKSISSSILSHSSRCIQECD